MLPIGFWFCRGSRLVSAWVSMGLVGFADFEGFAEFGEREGCDESESWELVSCCVTW